MGALHHLETGILYQNPKPHVRSRHGYFPGVVRLRSGELLALLVIGEAFESADSTTWVTRSGDNGTTWTLQGPLYDKSLEALPASDYMKPTLLRDGTLIALGYRFHRRDPEEAIGIDQTGGLLPGDDIVSFSRDDGKTWTVPRVVPRTHPELLEISGPCLELAGGDLLAVAAPFKLPDGSNPSGQVGVLLRSRDRGQSWADNEFFFRSPDGNMAPLESRICQMPDGSLVTISWAYDYVTGTHFPNHVAVSHDDGHSWSLPRNTGHMGQAASLFPWENKLLLSAHAHRGETPGIYVRLVDFSGDCWKPLEEIVIYGAHSKPQTRSGQDTVEMFSSLRFGQPSLIRLNATDVLAVHWAIEEGLGKIRMHRLRIESER